MGWQRSCRLLFAALAVAGASAATVRPARAAEEFCGPFASWANVKRDYGARGDGKADDTAAIQRALDDLREHKSRCVLYLPAGTYRITRTLHTDRKAHTDCMGVAVVGEDPAKTTLRWDGPDGGMMLRYDAWYSKIGRLALDGAGRAGVALAYGDAFSTYNETSDMIIKDVATGMQMGTATDGQAENAVLRCRFLRCSNAGLETVNFNSMDEWVWDCRFEACGTGLLNAAGNFHAYRNLFLGSKTMDVGIRNLMVFSLIDNSSIGSRGFMDWESGHTWGAQTSVTGNRIDRPTGDFAARLGNAGPYLFAWNTIRSRPGKRTPEVVMTWADQALVGNRYTIANPVETRGRYRMLDERVVPPEQAKIAPPALPETPPRRERPTIEVAAGADAAAIQSAIERAAALRGKRPVVHLPMGVYSIDRTVTVPAGLDVQIVGDAGAETGTVLRWSGRAGEPLLLLKGPSRAALRDFEIETAGGVGIRATACDGPGGRIFGDEVNVSGRSPSDKGDAGLLVDGVERSDVLMRCLQGGSDVGAWVRVAGGPMRRAGKAPPGQVTVLCGATGTSDTPYRVEKGGRLVVRSVYHEMSGAAPQALLLDGSGSLAIDATRFSYGTMEDRPLIAVDGFRGDLTLATCLLLPVGSQAPARIEVRGDGSRTSLLALGNCFWQNRRGVTTAMLWRDTSKPPAHAAMVVSNMDINAPTDPGDPAKSRSGYAPVEDRGMADDAFMRRMLAPLRDARIWTPGDAGYVEPRAGATALELHRVIVSAGGGGRGIELLAGP